MRQTAIPALCVALTFIACGRDKARSPLAEAARACAHEHDSELSCPRPIFYVRSLRASQSYYRDQLGFKVDWEHGEPPDFGSVSRGDGVIFLCQRCQGNPGAWAMLFARDAKDVDRLHEEFRRKKAIIKMPPTDMPWHMREMHVSDPDGNVLRVGAGIDH